jgi:soluble lytic murein transglycosylase-like protein
LKKSGYLLAGLFLIGLVGLFLALFELNASYEVKYKAFNHLTGEVNRLDRQMREAKAVLDENDRLLFLEDALLFRYPIYFRIVEVAFEKSREYGFEPELLLGIIEVESGFNPTAVSRRGAYGLMQINLAVWSKELGIDRSRIFDIEYNIDLGLQILKRYYVKTRQNMTRALHLYNNGYKYKNTAYVRRVNSAVARARRLRVPPGENPGSGGGAVNK